MESDDKGQKFKVRVDASQNEIINKNGTDQNGNKFDYDAHMHHHKKSSTFANDDSDN